ncbi:MAG: glycosyltransferase family 39 protein, partial [Ilumatobacteraceae bacterium]
MRDRGFWICTLTAAAAGVVLRVVYVLAVVRGRIPLNGDAETYHLLGAQLANGEGYIRPTEFMESGARIPTAEFPPMYPMFLAGVDLLGVDSPVGQRVVGALLGGVTIVVIALLGAAVAGRTAGMAAAWVAAAYPQLVLLDGSLMSEGLATLLIATVLLAVVSARSAESDRRRRTWWAVAGAATGLAVMTRSEFLLLVPLLLVPATRSDDRRAWARTAAVACASTIVFTGAWTVRNAASLGHFQPFTNNSGTALAGANCDAVYSGVQIGGWRLDCVPSGLSEDETVRAGEARRIGLEYARDHAGELPSVVAARLGRTVGVWDVRSNLFFESLESRDYDWLWAAWIAWLVLAPLAIVGAVAQRRA